MDFSAVISNINFYFSGLLTTLYLVFVSLFIGLLIAIPLALLRNSSNLLLRGPSWVYIYFLRGTPLLVQMYLLYYGLDQFYPVKDTLWETASFCAIVAFTLNTSAYTAEILRGAINGLPYGEIEAAKAYGMSSLQRYRRIIFPYAFGRALPAYSNEVIFMLHGSAIAGVITILDITGAARLVSARNYIPFEAYITAAFFYGLITFSMIYLFRYLESVLLRYQQKLVL